MALIFQKDQHKYARYAAHIVHLGHVRLSGLLYTSDRVDTRKYRLSEKKNPSNWSWVWIVSHVLL